MKKNLVASSTVDGGKSLLPARVITIIEHGMKVGFKDDRLDFADSGINDTMMPELCEWLVKLGDKVRKLNLQSNNIGSDGACVLFDTLRTSYSSMKAIELGWMRKIDDKCMKSLGEYVKSNKHIERLNLDSTGLSSKGIEILAPYLDGNTTFKHLSLFNNDKILEQSIPLLVTMIESSAIDTVKVEQNDIDKNHKLAVPLACNAIKYGSRILHLTEDTIDEVDLIKICDLMKKHGISNLREINFCGNPITTKGAILLFQTLKECSSVVSKIDMTRTNLNDESMKSLGELIQDNEYLETLVLFDNCITDKGIEILKDYIVGNTVLKVLMTGLNEDISEKSVPYFLEIANASSISRIDVWITSIPADMIVNIEKAVAVPLNEREIPIKSNTKSAAKASASTS